MLNQASTRRGITRVAIAAVVVFTTTATPAMAPDQTSGAVRSRALRAQFQRLHPCPATQSPQGACPGYQVDHRLALVCGGTDTLDNLQWLDLTEHRAKTRVEVKLCRPSPAPL